MVADPGFLGSKAYTIWGVGSGERSSLRKSIQIYQYKIRYKFEHLF